MKVDALKPWRRVQSRSAGIIMATIGVLLTRPLIAVMGSMSRASASVLVRGRPKSSEPSHRTAPVSFSPATTT